MNKQETQFETFLVCMMMLFLILMIICFCFAISNLGKFNEVKEDLDYSLQTNRVFYEDYCINSSISNYSFYHKCDNYLDAIEVVENKWSIERDKLSNTKE